MNQRTINLIFAFTHEELENPVTWASFVEAIDNSTNKKNNMESDEYKNAVASYINA